MHKLRISSLIVLVSGLFFACNPLGKPVDPELSDNYYFTKDQSGVIFSPMGNWFELGKTAMNIDASSFEVLGAYFAKDKDHVYYQSKPIQVDIGSFRVINEPWMWHIGLDKDHVYSFDSYNEPKVILNADPHSYSKSDFDWAEDQNNHFYRDQIVAVDHETFKIVNDFFAVDSIQGYCYAEDRFESFSANVNHFKRLDDYYAHDDQHIFYYAWYVRKEPVFSLKSLPYDAFSQVRVLDENHLRIAQKIYCQGFLIEEAEANTFELVGGMYAKDVDHVFYWGQNIPGADATSFQFDEANYSFKDKNHTYDQGRPTQ